MNKIIGIVFALLVIGPGVRAQDQPDTTKASKARQATKHEKFIDTDGDGINDRLQRRQKAIRRGNDKFIDRDGDGICDDRVSGLGFRRYRGGAKAPAQGTTGNGKGPGGRR
jgi:hypothetical protein